MAVKETATISVCIPNFNYADFIGETIESVVQQSDAEYEIVVVDNASTDASVEIITRYLSDPRIRLQVNPVNVGFAGNLDRVGSLASKEYMILLSSDDVMEQGALSAYSRLLAHASVDGRQVIIGSDFNFIDADGRVIERLGRDTRLWDSAEVDEEASTLVGYPVYAMDARRLLLNSLRLMRSPFGFASTCYSRDAYNQVGGYGGTQGINPDKGFAWKALSVSAMAYHIEHPFFGYRVHGGGQASIQTRQDALNFLVDEYRYTYDLPDFVFASSGMARSDLCSSFLYEDIYLRGLNAVADGDRRWAKRAAHFGRATFPEKVRSSPWYWGLRLASGSGPVGTLVMRAARRMLAARSEGELAAHIAERPNVGV